MVADNEEALLDSDSATPNKLVLQARRDFVTGTVAFFAGAVLLSIGVFTKLFAFFFGPRLSEVEERKILETRVKRLEDTVALEKLELERQHNEYILIARLDGLDRTTGKYFVDYEMRPALAFLGDDGLPILLSAKCTHLGCTVGNKVNEHDQVLCPCHISYFDVKTGQPNPGAPAKLPLAHLSWVIKDNNQKIIAQRTATGKTVCDIKGAILPGACVYLAKHLESGIS